MSPLNVTIIHKSALFSNLGFSSTATVLRIWMFKTKHNSSAGNSFDNWWSVRRCSQTCGLQKNAIAAGFKWQVNFLQK